MLLNHRQLTEKAVAHLSPLRLVDVTWGPGERDDTRSVLCLYEHLEGGWVTGEVGCDPLTGVPDAEQVSVQTSVGWSEPEKSDVAPLLARFDALVREREASGTIEQLRSLHSMPVEVEARLAGAMQRTTSVPFGTWASDAPSAQGLSDAMCPATRISIFEGLSDTSRWSADDLGLMLWIEGLSSAGGPLWPQTKVQIMEARCWAYLLTEAAASQQDGVGDALRLLDRRGPEAFCDLLPDPALDFLATRVAKAREGFGRPRMPRYTVADFVHGSMALFANVLLAQWEVSPMQPAAAAL